MFAKALAGELELPLYAVSSTQLIAGLSGESEKRIRELFSEVVKNAPAVLLFDDIDIIAAKRENAQREMERRIVTQLIASIDGRVSIPERLLWMAHDGFTSCLLKISMTPV